MLQKKKKQKFPQLTAWEMEIMQVLWKTGGATIATARESLNRSIGYTTVQTRLNRLVDKGLAVKTATRPTQYQPAVAPDDVSAGHLDLLVRRVSDGHVVPLIAQLMKDHEFTKAEIAALKRLIDEQEQQLPEKEVSDA